MHIGWRRFRTAAGRDRLDRRRGHAGHGGGHRGGARGALPAWTGAWPCCVGTAVAATDPAVVFSVFGRREIAGRTGTLLEGESGANDPVGIALLAALLAAHGDGGERRQARGGRLRAADGRRGGHRCGGRPRPAGVHAPGAAAQRGPVLPPRAGRRAGDLRGRDRRARLRVPRGLRRRDLHRRRARPVQAGDRAVPLIAGQPGGDRGVRHARPDHAPVQPRQRVRLGRRPSPSCAARVRHPPAARRAGVAAHPAVGGRNGCSSCGPASRAPCPSCSAPPSSNPARPAPPGPTRSSSSSSASR